MQFSEKMTQIETRATAALASIYGLRMLGMFLILPIFAIYAETLQGGDNHALIGLALGAYGFMQVISSCRLAWRLTVLAAKNSFTWG